LNSLVKTLRSLAIANPPQLNLGLHTILTHCPIWWDQTNTSWSPARTLTHALPHPARLGNRSRESALRQLDPRGGGDGFTSLALEGRPSLGLLVVLEMLIDPLLFRVIQIAWLVGSLV